MPRIKSLFKSDFARHNAIFFAGSMSTAFLNYLFYPVLSRLLSVTDFGEVQAIFSLSGYFGIVLGVLGMVALNIVTNREHEPSREPALQDLQSLGIYITLAGIILILLLRNSLSSFFQFSSTLPFVMLAGILLVSIPLAFRRSYLQALKYFGTVSIGAIIIAGGRLVLAVLLVFAGFKTSGALGGYIIAQIICFIYFATKTAGVDSLRFKAVPSLNSQTLRELKYGLLVLLGTGYTSFFSTADIIFSKHYFDPVTAGFYSGISTVSSIILFATTSVSAVMLSDIKRGNTFDQNLRTFYKALALLAAIALSAFVIFFAFPHFIVTLLLGSRYGELAYLLPLLSIVALLGAIANLFFFYFLALQKYIMAIPALCGIALTASVALQNHKAPVDIVHAFIWGSLLSVILLLAIFVNEMRKGKYGHSKKSDEEIERYSTGLQ